MEVEEIRLLLSLIENAQIQGALVVTMASVIEKLQKIYELLNKLKKEAKKLMPKQGDSFGQK